MIDENETPQGREPERLLYDWFKHLTSLSLLTLGGVLSLSQAGEIAIDRNQLTIVLLFVAAGLCAYAVHEFGEAGVIANSGQLFDLSGVLPESSPLGALLSGLFGYRPSPTPLEVLAYFAYLIPVVAIYIWTDRPRHATTPATA